MLCLSGVLAGTVLRSAGPAWVILAGTAVIGVAITLGNIAVLVIIRRDVPWRQVSLATGAYSAAMNVGSMHTLLVTAPLAGWMNVVTANWTAPLLLVLALTVMFCVGGLTAARLAERSQRVCAGVPLTTLTP